MKEEKSLATMAGRFDELFLPETKDDLFKLSEMYSKSNLTPVCFRGKAADIIIAWSLGMPLGLSMMQCLLGIAVINGRPTLWGDVLNGLVLSQPDLEKFNEEYSKEKNEWTCIIQRKGRDEVSRTFSEEEAKLADLLPGKEGSAWKKYPKRMIQMRARGFCIRDSYSDRTSGLNVDAGDLIDITDTSRVLPDDPTPKIADKIAAKADNVTETAPKPQATETIPPEKQKEEQRPTDPPQADQMGYKDIDEVVASFRSAADVESLQSMIPLIDKVDPAFKEEVVTVYDQAVEELAKENQNTTNKPEMSENQLVKKLSVICVSINRDKKAEIARELFNDNKRKIFRVRELDGEQLHKLKGILEERGLFQ